MLDKSVCDVSIGEETVDARSPNFAFLCLMNVGPMGPTLARGGKLTLARCVWYPGPGLMEKACFHSCQSHLLRATPRLHTRTVKTTTSPSLTLLSPARHRDSLFLLSSGPVWEEIMSEIIQITQCGLFFCRCFTLMCLGIICRGTSCKGPCECFGHRGFRCKLDILHILRWFILVRGNLCSVAHWDEITASYMEEQRRGDSSFLNLCGWRVALLIGVSGGSLIDGLIACSPNLERGGGRGRNKTKERRE